MDYSRSISNDAIHGPKLEEWAVISKHRALEDQKMKEMEKMEQYYKKMKFKSDLDQQLSQKNNSYSKDQQADQKYYQYVLKKTKEDDERQHKEKIDKFSKRLSMQSHNRQVVQIHKHSPIKDSKPDYQLDIGIKSEVQQKLREQKGKREMMDTLDVQVKQKQQESKIRKMQDYIKDMEHYRKEANIFGVNRNNKQYKQDQRVYHHYAHLMEDKHKKIQQVEKQYIDEAARRKSEQTERTKNYNDKRREELAHNMKQTLDQQVKIHNYQKSSEKMTNPEDASYGFIANVFRDKPPSYDKMKYYEDLRKQAEEQKNRKKRSNFMSEQQYKYNRNQLNKIVNGSFAHQKYVDRSLGVIGEKRIDAPVMHDENSSFIRDRLSSLRGNRSNGIFSQMEYSNP